MQPLRQTHDDNVHQSSLSTLAVPEQSILTPEVQTIDFLPSKEQEDHLFQETMSFQDLNLSSNVLKALKKQGYKHPSLIQVKGIPPILQGKDVIGTSQTGSGKTAAFALPIITRLTNETTFSQKRPLIQVLILAPTRELALQIQSSFKKYGEYSPITSTCIYGGVSQREQVKSLKKGVNVLVATPGRLIDLYLQGHVDFKHVQTLVLDEADRMLDMGFMPDIKRIITFLPQRIQTLFFSATMPEQVKTLAREILHDPVTITIHSTQKPVETIQSMIYFVEKTEKLELLRHVLGSMNISRVLIFTRTKRAADTLAKKLNRQSLNAESIHGDKSQASREKALRKFKHGKTRILVATDVVARGIDVDNISHVINYELPDEPEMYLHRIGRTGRAGKVGTALTFCSREEIHQFKSIERFLQDHIPRKSKHPYAMRSPPSKTDLTQPTSKPSYHKKRSFQVKSRYKKRKSYNRRH